MRQFKIVYSFKDRSMGFQNSITVSASNEIEAMLQAKQKVAETYHMQPIKKFSFSDAIQLP